MFCQADFQLLQLFRLWLGITEYVYRNKELLDECIETALTDNTFVSDDLEFTFAARVRRNLEEWFKLTSLTVSLDIGLE